MESIGCYKKTEIREAASIVAWSISNSLYTELSDHDLASYSQYWQHKLNSISRECQLSIRKSFYGEKCVYTIVISFAPSTLQSIEVEKML